MHFLEKGLQSTMAEECIEESRVFCSELSFVRCINVCKGILEGTQNSIIRERKESTALTSHPFATRPSYPFEMQQLLRFVIRKKLPQCNGVLYTTMAQCLKETKAN